MAQQLKYQVWFSITAFMLISVLVISFVPLDMGVSSNTRNIKIGECSGNWFTSLTGIADKCDSEQPITLIRNIKILGPFNAIIALLLIFWTYLTVAIVKDLVNPLVPS